MTRIVALREVTCQDVMLGRVRSVDLLHDDAGRNSRPNGISFHEELDYELSGLRCARATTADNDSL